MCGHRSAGASRCSWAGRAPGGQRLWARPVPLHGWQCSWQRPRWGSPFAVSPRISSSATPRHHRNKPIWLYLPASVSCTFVWLQWLMNGFDKGVGHEQFRADLDGLLNCIESNALKALSQPTIPMGHNRLPGRIYL